ncbi:hypothetical protein LX73_0153 [Fodinibius salinus]|uniref:Uncharacterized protein n=1 Tax=Fodinibius salinus TaxID=860790 RepID=A0A5D3YPA3_9BACT|nr:hypothetical protein [Fodinibius salinus]TYP94863.1 hypothetical protein LX73_0153 [Fodinibius salinus]
MDNSLVIKPKSKQKELAPTGLQPACCMDVWDRGIQQNKFGERHELSLIFELQATNSEGEHFILSSVFTKSLHPKSNLRAELQRWRGQPFSDDELSQGFNLEKIIGQACMLLLTQHDNYVRVDSIMPPNDDHIFKGSGNYTRIKDR